MSEKEKQMGQNIYGRINAYMAEFESITGCKPRFLYLGFEEWKELEDFLSYAYAFKLSAGNNKIWDLELLYVPKKQHLGVGN